MPHSPLATGLDHLFAPLEERLDELRRAGSYREFKPCSYLADAPGHALHRGRRIEVWCSNDYLGMSHHPEVIDAQVRSTLRHGTGNGGSRNIAGTSEAHAELENRLASWHGKPRALIFTSGYVANQETLTVLLHAIPDLVVFSDRLNHRSLIEGIRSGEAASRHVYPHNDLAALEDLLAAYPLERPKLIVCESLYSMDGDLTPLGEVCDLAERYGALTYVDETHAIGVLGPTGAGLAEDLGEHRPTFIQGVFGKAVGTTGGYVAGPDGALDFVRSTAPGFIFTTTIPRPNLDATLQSLELIQGETGARLRARLAANADHMRHALSGAGIDFIDAPSHLVPVLVPGEDRVRRVARRLMDRYSRYVQPVNYPSVARGSERFRLTVPPYRTHEQIDVFVDSLKACLTLG
ncbi:5-aminolevulinate synthase [Streptomyces sp. SID4928]|uniref:5-aminolevulinate synthase n=1 Tax=unclassified Streptomyces TaxID=2593676 RepID=UPI0001C19C23|nr:5-aminolevulinate synthase [Streptomyces sp. ACT-1]EGE39623.1 5-aminolevulinic acid synthase [Streptomyces sp. ACT-1]MYR47712.1 5-aminolevulinate synthase [Streptomyces sp. SID4928]